MSGSDIPTFRGYARSDLLEAFLSCALDAHSKNGGGPHPQIDAAKKGLDELSKKSKRGPMLASFADADLASCMQAIGSPMADAFDDDTSHHLWNMLKEALTEIEPLALRRRVKIIPRTLDHIWTLLEAAALECGTDQAGEDGKEAAGSGAKRL